MKYTAQEGGTELKGKVVSELMDALNILIKDVNENQGLFTVIDVRHEFADEWA